MREFRLLQAAANGNINICVELVIVHVTSMFCVRSLSCFGAGYSASEYTVDCAVDQMHNSQILYKWSFFKLLCKKTVFKCHT